MTIDMRTALTDYLRLRRGLGFSLCRGEKLLVQFLDYLDERGRADFTVDDALAWAKLPEPASPGWLGGRLTVVRGFAAYLHCLDSSVPAIPPGLLPGRGRRAVPYLYSDEDLVALLRQTQTLQTPLRAATMRTLVGLLAVTGIRLSEALAVDDGHFDVDAGVLLVRHGKFGKQRLLPLRPSTVEALTAYRTVRDGWFPIPVSPALLVSQAGTRLLVSNVELTFARLVHPGVRLRQRWDDVGPKLSLLPEEMFVDDIHAAWNPLTRDDVVVNLYTPGRLWSAHYFYNDFAHAAGASVIPFGALNDDEIGDWLTFFEEQGMTCIMATPTTIKQLLRHCATHGRSLPGLRKLLWVGERYDAETAAMVGRQLPGVEVWGNYGSTETWVIGWNTPTCPTDTFHLLPYQHVECVDEAVVVTNTHRRGLNPLLRYTVGDRGVLVDCPCGRPVPALRVDGRVDSYFKFLNQMVSPEEIVGLAQEVDGVVEAQLVLYDPGLRERLELRVRADRGDDGEALVARVRRHVLVRHLELGYVVSSAPDRFVVRHLARLERNARTAKTPTLVVDSVP